MSNLIGNIQEGEKIVGSRHRVKVKKNKPLFYIYYDGTVEKKIIIE